MGTMSVNACRGYLPLFRVIMALWAASPAVGQTPGDVARPAGTVRLAMLRAVPVKWDLAANFAVFEKGVQLAAQAKADILVTPECWLDGYVSPTKESTPEKILGIAQDPRDSEYLRRVAAAARDHRLVVCFGFTSREEGKAFDAAGLWDADGRCLGIYHKTHLQRHDLQYAPGQSLPVWPTRWGDVGIMICADRRWSETARVLRLEGARLILNPSYGFHGDLNEAMMRTRAYENQCFIVFAHPQESLVTGPTGKVLFKEDTKEGQPPRVQVGVCDVDLSQARDDNHLRDRRPELYRIISAPGPSE